MSIKRQTCSFSSFLMRSGAVASGLLLVLANSYSAKAEVNQIWFDLRPVRQFLPCLAARPGIVPTARVRVKRGKFNDEMTIFTTGFKPGLKFDAFTVQNTFLLTNGQIDPNFKNFGLAWYQTDLDGNIPVKVKTILLDQIFGFAPQVDLKPTKTFHVGFWFNDPKDARACGFDVTKPTPFNGEQKAGPLAFISVPNPITKLGPLCTKPRRESSTTFVCDP
jgi:hypothetical protein